MDGLIREADNIAGEVDDKKVLDAAIIGSAQAIEHYEISRYGTVIAWAEWFRATACFRREDSSWRITHMHNSVPFAMDDSQKALLHLKP